MRVAEISIPSRSRTNVAVQRAAARRPCMPLTSSEAIDAAAWLIAQPWPEKRTSSIAAVVVDAQHLTRSSSPHSGLVSSNSRSGSSSTRRPVVGPLVVLEDVLAVEVVHQQLERPSCTPRRARRRAGRRPRAWCGSRTRRARSPRRRGGASAAARSGGRRARRRRRGRGSRRRRAGARPRARTSTSAPRASRSRGPWIVRPGDRGQALERVGRRGRARARAPAPCRCRARKSTAAPSPIASAIGDVPASNFAGSSAQRDSSASTREIMCPPPRNGGIASSSSRRPCRTPMPVGP